MQAVPTSSAAATSARSALCFASCHAAYCEHSCRTGFEGEVPDRKAMRRQVQESHRRNGYGLETDARACFNGRDDRRRAVLIDIERAKQTNRVVTRSRREDAAPPSSLSRCFLSAEFAAHGASAARLIVTGR